jgi:hypothetical protein
VYGTENCIDKGWSIKFDEMTFDQLLFISKNKLIWMILEKTVYNSMPSMNNPMMHIPASSAQSHFIYNVYSSSNSYKTYSVDMTTGP